MPCEKCGGYGFIPTGKHDDTDWEMGRCTCAEEEIFRSRLSSIPTSYHDSTIDGVRSLNPGGAKSAEVMISRLASGETPKKSVALYASDTTTMSMAIVVAALRRGLSAERISVSSVIGASIGSNDALWSRIVSKATSLLVIECFDDWVNVAYVSAINKVITERGLIPGTGTILVLDRKIYAGMESLKTTEYARLKEVLGTERVREDI